MCDLLLCVICLDVVENGFHLSMSGVAASTIRRRIVSAVAIQTERTAHSDSAAGGFHWLCVALADLANANPIQLY